jgi:GxxExxY protein
MAELIEKDLVYRIVGSSLAVLKELGHGLREKTYERALCVEFRHQGIAFSQQVAHPVHYRGEQIDEYIPDLEVEGRVIVDTKTIPCITDTERGQMINYLRVTGLKVGLIINFKNPKLEWERIVLDSSR